MRKRTLTAAHLMASLRRTAVAVAMPLSITCVANGTEANVRIVGDISEFGDNNASAFEEKVNALVKAGVRDARVYIRTRGGDVFEANEMVNILSRFPGEVHGTGGAMVASAGTMVGMNLDSFVMPKNGMFMWHKPMGVCVGNEDELKSELKLIGDLTSQYRSLYAEKTGMTEDEVEALWSKGDQWLTAKEAHEKGFITGVLDEEEEVNEEEATAWARLGVPKNKMKIAASAANKPKTDMDIKAMAAAMGMPADSTEAQVLARAAELRVASENAQRLAAAARTAEVKALLDGAIKDRKLTEAHRASYEAKFATNFDATKAEVEALVAAPVIADTVTAGAAAQAGTDDARKDWKYNDWADKDNKGLLAMIQGPTATAATKAKFQALYTAHYGKAAELPA